MALIADGRVFEGQTYMFVNKAYPNRALNVWCSSSYPATNQSNVCLWTKDTTDTAQHWVIDRIAGNNYVLKSVENPQVYLDLYTGSGTGANSNAQLYEYEDDSDTCFLKFEAGGYSDTVHIKLAGTTNNGYFLTAYSDANGTRTGKSNTSAGNVFFQKYEIFDDRKEWIPVPIGTTSGGESTTGQKLVGPYTYSGVSNDYQSEVATDCPSCYPYSFHYGTDFKGREDNGNETITATQIRASGNGVVTSIRTDNNESTPLGNTVLVRYDNVLNTSGVNIGSVYFRYCHLASINVVVNQNVTATTVIGIRGTSGSGCEEDQPHLHLEATTNSSATASSSPSEASNPNDAYKFDVRNVLYTKTSNSGFGKRILVTDNYEPFNSGITCGHGKTWYSLYDAPSYD